MASIKRSVLLNVLVWIFPQKFVLNDLVYLKFWEHENQEKPLIDRQILSQFQIIKALNDQVV